MTIENEFDAQDRAREALSGEGYDDVTLDEPHQDGNTWIVPAEHADGRVNVHIETDTGIAEVADLGG